MQCHLNKQRVADGSRRSPMAKKVKWSEEVQTRVIEEWENESVVSVDDSSSDSRSDSSSSRDTMSPTQLYSTRYTGLRRLRPSPHPHFNSEALQNPRFYGQRVCATIKVESFIDPTTKMPSTRFSTPMAALDSAPAAAPSSVGSSTPFRGSTDTLNESRRSSSSSSSMSPPSSVRHHQHEGCRSSPSASSVSLHSHSATTASHSTRFAVSGTMVGASRLEAGLEGVCQLLNKTHSCQIGALHVQTSDPMLADIVGNMQQHLRTEFATFAWPRALTERVQEILRRISVLTLVVEITIEYIPEKEGLFRRVSHQIKSVLQYFRLFR